MRSPRALVAVLALLAVAQAAAQVPSPSPAGVEVDSDETQVTVSVEDPATVEVTVRNTGSPTGTPFDQPRTVAVSVGGVPAGWTVGVDPAVVRLRPGESDTVTLSILPSADSGAERATLNVTARLYPFGVSGVPGAGSSVDPESTDSLDLQARRDESLARDVKERVGLWATLVALGLLAAFLVTLKFALAGRRAALVLHAAQTEATVPPGGRVTLPMVVDNRGRRDDVAVFQVSAVAPGWAAFLPVPELSVGAGDAQEVGLVVIAPVDAKAGDQVSVLVTATSQQAPSRPASKAFEVTVASEGRRKRTS